MVYYIKANPKVAQDLKVQTIRNQFPDGNYLLWWPDLLKYGTRYEISAICRRIGAVTISPEDTKREMNGEIVTPLPLAEEKDFQIINEQQEPAEPADSENQPAEDETPVESDTEKGGTE